MVCPQPLLHFGWNRAPQFRLPGLGRLPVSWFSGVAIAAISKNSGRLSLSVNRMIDVPSESVRASRPPGPLEEPLLSFPDWVLVVTTRRRTVVCRNPSTCSVVENLLGAVLLPQASSRFFPATLLWERFRRVLGRLGLSSHGVGVLTGSIKPRGDRTHWKNHRHLVRSD